MATRVIIPNNPEDLIALAKEVRKKHTALGKNSPLGALPWGKVGPGIDKALELHKQAEKLKREMEKAYDNRDKKIPAIKDIVRRSRDMLKGVYGSNVKSLGDFGFTVDTSKRKKKK